MELAQRRVVARVARFGLVVLAIMLVAVWGLHRLRSRITLHTEPEVAAVTMAAGDVRLFNEDSTVNLILRGDQILAGLSPQLVAKIRGELATAGQEQGSGFGAAIAQAVTQQVSEKIGTHVTFAIDDIEELRYEDGFIVAEWKDGSTRSLFGSRNDNDDSHRFPEADARRFIEAVKARQR